MQERPTEGIAAETAGRDIIELAAWRDRSLSTQFGRIPDYDHFLAELDHAWMECKRVLVPGGRICCVIGDILIPRKVDGRHRVLPLSADHIPRHRRRLPRMILRLLRPPRPTPPADTDPRRRQTNVVPGRNERKSMGGWNPFHTARLALCGSLTDWIRAIIKPWTTCINGFKDMPSIPEGTTIEWTLGDDDMRVGYIGDYIVVMRAFELPPR